MKGKDMKATAKAWMGRLAQELKEKERWKAITFWREENELHEVTEQCFCFIDMLWYIQHRWSFCCLHIYSFNALPQAPLYSSIKRGGFELPCAILFGLAHIETRGLRRVYETALRSWFGESSNFNHMKGRFVSMKQKNQWVGTNVHYHHPSMNQFFGLYSRTFCPLDLRLDWFETCSNSRNSK